jgi:hypothetical protein
MAGTEPSMDEMPMWKDATLDYQSIIDPTTGQPFTDANSAMNYITNQYIANAGYGQTGSMFGGLLAGFKTGLGDIFNDPSRLLTGIDPVNTDISNALLGQNNPAITNFFGTPSNTTWDQTAQQNPGMGLENAKQGAFLSDAIAGSVLGANVFGGIGGGAGSGSSASGAGAGSGALGDDLGNTITVLGNQGGGLSGLGAAGSAGGGVYNAGNTVTVNGTPPGGGALPGYLQGAGIAGNIGAGMVNGQPNIDTVTVEGQKQVPTNPDNNNTIQDMIAALGGGAAVSATGGSGGSGSTNGASGFDWTNLIGPLINGLGSYLGGQQSSNAANQAAQLAINASRPFNVNLPGFGNSAFDMENRTASITPQGSLGDFQNYGSNLSAQGYNNLSQGPANLNGFGGISPQLYGAFQGYAGSPYNAPGANIYGNQQAYNGLMTQAGNAAGGLFNQLGGFNLQNQESNNLNALRSQAQFGESQAQQNNLESQFGKGILASTAGQYQTQGLNNSLQMADVQRQQLAHQMAMSDQQSILGSALNATSGYNNLQQTGYGQNYQNQVFGNNAANQMFGNALNLFGAGQAANQQSFGQNASLWNQGQANNLGVGSYLSGLLGMGGSLGSLASGAAGQGAGIIAQNGQNQGNLLAGFLNNLGSSVDWSKLFGKSGG